MYGDKVRGLGDCDPEILHEDFERRDDGGGTERAEHGMEGDLHEKNVLAPGRPVVRVCGKPARWNQRAEGKTSPRSKS